jgi:D-beta-D-heptose 7-phosphate kinase/D-beta-D-heptose 1-phosphate adenosyltransferase
VIGHHHAIRFIHRQLAAFDSFDEDTPLALMDALRPDILVKGGDYTLASIIGAKEVGLGRREVYSIKLRVNRSTTALMRKLRNTELS